MIIYFKAIINLDMREISQFYYAIFVVFFPKSARALCTSNCISKVMWPDSCQETVDLLSGSTKALLCPWSNSWPLTNQMRHWAEAFFIPYPLRPAFII